MLRKLDFLYIFIHSIHLLIVTTCGNFTFEVVTLAPSSSEHDEKNAHRSANKKNTFFIFKTLKLNFYLIKPINSQSLRTIVILDTLLIISGAIEITTPFSRIHCFL